MKKFFAVFAALCVMLIVFSSCAKEEKPFEQKVVNFKNCFEFIENGRENEVLTIGYDDISDDYKLLALNLVTNREETDFTAAEPDYYGAFCASSGEEACAFIKIYIDGEKIYTEACRDNKASEMLGKDIIYYCPKITAEQFSEILSFAEVKTR